MSPDPAARRIAFVFPGQGSQHPGMGRELFEWDLEARLRFEAIDASLGFALSRLCFEGSAEDLALTVNTQPAVLAHSIVAWHCLVQRGIEPDYVAGHSLGEYSALVAAGGLGVADAARTVRNRGRYMQEAVPVGVGAMAAILALDRAAVRQLCDDARQPGEVLSPANFNSPGQVVIAGHAAAVRRALEMAPERGARRSVLLPVSAPFHCELMAPAAERLAGDLASLRMAPFAIPLVANVTAREVSDPEVERDLLRRQVTAPVLWEDCVLRLVALGVTHFVEVGPGRVLAGLIKRTSREAVVLPCAVPAEVDAVFAALC